MKTLLKLTLLLVLAGPALGPGQPDTAARLASLLAAAQKAQAASDYSEALRDYREAVKIRPDIPELWANQGLMQQESDEIAGAIVSFQKANRLNPSLYVPNLFLGIDYVRTGKSEEAIPLLMKAEKINKTDPQAPLALGRAYISAGRFSAAAGALGRATTLDPKLGSAWFTLGIALLDEVEDDARRMSAEGKESPFAGALYAESLYKQGRFGEAATLYKTLIDSRPQPPCLRSELGFALLRDHEEDDAAQEFRAERATQPECALAWLGQARLAFGAGDNATALALLRDLWSRDHGFVESNAAVLLEGWSSEQVESIVGFLSAQNDPSVPAALRNALLAAFDGSGLLEAVPTGDDKAGAQEGRRASAGGATADELYASGQFEQCELQLEAAKCASNAGRLRLLAECAFSSGDAQRASSATAALETLEPHSLEALYWSIQADERLAFQSLARFQQLEPDSARSHVLLGDIYHQLERHDDAQAEYLKALAVAPGDPAAMLGLASAYLSNNNVDGAREIAQSALTRRPDDPELNLIMAEVKLSQNAYADAEPYLKKSLAAKPQMIPRVHALMGKVFAETGRTNEAIEQLKLGASSDVDGSIQYLLARLYRKQGDAKDASEALERMKTIKQQRAARGFKRVEDPELSASEFPLNGVSTP